MSPLSFLSRGYCISFLDHQPSPSSLYGLHQVGPLSSIQHMRFSKQRTIPDAITRRQRATRLVHIFAGRVKHFSIGERLTLTWLVMTGIIHMVVEGKMSF